MIRLLALAGAVFLLLAPQPAVSQQVFRSHQAANLPTAETLPAGAWLFEISHRFDRAISEGSEAFWGLDGPVLNRLGLTYAPTGAVMLQVQRSNFQDNIDLNARVRLFEGGPETLPMAVAVLGGIAWNTEVTELEGAEDGERQAYAQLVVNARVGGRLALGVVPAYLRNPRIRDVEEDDAFVLGLNAQAYLTDAVSVLGEWIVTEEREDLEHDAVTLGVDLQTRGHHFKLVLTNQARMNPSQHLGGTPTPFELDELRFGFNITRVLPF